MTRRRRISRAREALHGDGARTTPAGAFEVSPIRLIIVILVAVKIVGVLLIFDPGSALAFEGPKASFSIATTCLLLGLAGLAVLRFGFASTVRTRLHLFVAAFALSSVLATVLAEDRYVAAFGAQRRLGLTFVLDMVVLYFAVALAYRTRKDWALLAIAVGCAGFGAMGYGLLQFSGLDPVPWFESTRQRPPSTFGNPDKFGHFLGTTFLAAIGLSIVPRLPSTVRLLAVTYAAVALTTAVLVATRGTLIGIAVASPVLGLIFLRFFRPGPRGRTLLLLAGAGIGAAALTVALVAATPLGERVRGGFTDPATRQRIFVADAAIRAFRDQPLTGYGPDNFGVIYPRYRPVGSVATGGLAQQDSAHSLPLQTLATTGALGALSLGSVAVGSFVLLWRAIPASPSIAVPLLAGAVAYWAQSAVAIGSVSIDWVGWLAAGGAATFGRRPAGALQRPRRLPVVQAALLGSAVILAISGYWSFQANRELYATRVARQVGRPDLAVRRAEEAIRLDSGRAEHWLALGLARQDRGNLGEAAQAFRSATDRAPYASAYWSTLAVTLTNLSRAGDTSLGGKEAALAAARRGIDADPNYPTPHNVFAVVANAFGEHAAALQASATAIQLFKGEPEYEAVAADAALRLQDATVARSTLEQLVQQKDVPVLRVALARISLKLNDVEVARTHLRRALEIDPQYAAARELAGQLGIPAP